MGGSTREGDERRRARSECTDENDVGGNEPVAETVNAAAARSVDPCMKQRWIGALLCAVGCGGSPFVEAIDVPPPDVGDAGVLDHRAGDDELAPSTDPDAEPSQRDQDGAADDAADELALDVVAHDAPSCGASNCYQWCLCVADGRCAPPFLGCEDCRC